MEDKLQVWQTKYDYLEKELKITNAQNADQIQ